MKKLSIGKLPNMTVPLFESGTVVFCRDFNEWHSLHSKLGITTEDTGSNGLSHTLSSDKGTLHIIAVFNGKLSTLAHECAHMAFDICNRVGVEVEPGRANETYCYLISRLVDFAEPHLKSRSDPA